MDTVRDLAKRESMYVKTLRAYISCPRISQEASVAGDKGERGEGAR